ncbi:MAG: efflux RND transporter permease subunit [Burkholderiaceae bacterium]|nr:efflux RND transporter permease subunit [Burkholderiaceae bacterium]
MFDGFFSFVLRQRVFVMLIVLALAVLGIWSFRQIPIEAFPDVQDVQVQVITQMPGLAAEEIERAVTLPIEREVGGTPRMTQMRSVSMSGLSIVTLIFNDGTNDYFARQQVNEKLQNAQLPPGVQPSLAPLATAVGEIYRYVLETPADAGLTEVRAIQDWTVRPALRFVPGVADVTSFGGAIREMQVQVNPERLRQYGITLDQVTLALGANSANAGGGLLKRGDEALAIRALGLFERPQDVASVVVTAKNGKSVFVSDIAVVALGERPRSGIVGINQRDDVVEGIVLMTKGGNASLIVAELERKVAQVNAALPRGYRIAPIYQRSTLIEHTVHTVAENLIVGAALVTAILFVFLRNWRAMVIVATVIPLSLLFGFILMNMMGVSANLISLGAVDFGVIIDSAVVLVEALMVRLALPLTHVIHGAGSAGAASAAHETAARPGQGTPAFKAQYGLRLHAIKRTLMDLAPPIIFSKAIIIIAFLPIFTFQRVEGRIFAPVALTLSFALLGGFLLTLTWVPGLLSFGVRGDMAERHLEWMHGLQARFRKMLLACMARTRLMIAGSLALVAITLACAPLLGTEFLPRLDEGNIWLTISLPRPTSIETTKITERKVRALLSRFSEVRTIITQVGRPDDGTDAKGSYNLEILIDLKPRGEWAAASKDELISQMSDRLRTIPGLPANFSQVIEDNVQESLSGAKGDIAVKIFGPDLQTLEAKGDAIARVLGSIPGAADVESLRVGGQSGVNVRIDRQRIARYGINIADINTLIQAAFGGVTVNSYFEGERRFDVTLRFALPYRDAVDDLSALSVSIPGGGGSVPLGDLATIDVSQGAARITREAGGRNVIVKTNLRGRDQGSFVAEAQRRVAAEVPLPAGYTLSWGGQFENQERATQRLKVIVPIAIGLIFALLFWMFRRIKPALLVLSMIPFTLVGGLAALGLAGFHLSISAAVGFIAVAGICVQNGVIMVEHVMSLARRGASLAEAVMEGAVSRLRPILMTAIMAGLGLLPAALSHGIGSETQRPFALVIVGGVVSATVFTLLLLPVLLQRFLTREDESSM